MWWWRGRLLLHRPRPKRSKPKSVMIITLPSFISYLFFVSIYCIKGGSIIFDLYFCWYQCVRRRFLFFCYIIRRRRLFFLLFIWYFGTNFAMFEFVFLLTPARTPQAIIFVIKSMFFGSFQNIWKAHHKMVELVSTVPAIIVTSGFSQFSQSHSDPLKWQTQGRWWRTDSRKVSASSSRCVSLSTWRIFQSTKSSTCMHCICIVFLSGTKEGGKRRTKHDMKSNKRSEKFSQKGIKTKRSKEKMFIEINKQRCGTYSIGKCTAPNTKKKNNTIRLLQNKEKWKIKR